MSNQGWRDILRELVRKSADLNALNSKRYTPFIYLLSGVIAICHEDDNHPWSFVLEIWLSDLRSSGVDLYEYGYREKELHENGTADRYFRGRMMRRRGGNVEALWRLVSFTYGSSPSDWHVHIERLGEDFWEDSDPAATMPGGWVEE